MIEAIVSYILERLGLMATTLYEIIPGRLFQSNLVTDQYVYINNNITVAVNVTTDSDAPIPNTPGYIYIWTPIVDGKLPDDMRYLNDMVEFATDLVKQGRRVNVNCSAGINRSALVCCLILREYYCITGKEAVQIMWAKHPGTLQNTDFLNYVLSLDKPDTISIHIGPPGQQHIKV